MLDKILVATKNSGKLKEIREILSGVTILGLADAGISGDVEETGSTFMENACIKATEIARLSGLPVLADDSGLMVDALSGAPGVYSARFAGENATDEDNIKKLLNELKDVPEEKRTARFVCAMCLIFPDGTKIEAFGKSCEGIILEERHGENGFGYDPVFFAPEYKKTFAEMTAEEKNQVSHRKAAICALSVKINEQYKSEKGENL